MSQSDSSSARPSIFKAVLLTWFVALLNLSLIATIAIVAVAPGVQNAPLIAMGLTVAVLVLATINLKLLNRWLLAGPFIHVVKAAAAAFLPMLFAAGPIMKGGGNVPGAIGGILASIAMFAGVLPVVSLSLGWFMSRCVGTDRAAVYRPMTAAELPAAARDFFLQRTVDLERFGFRHLGDYRVKEGMNQYSRLFTRDDGRVAAAVELTRMGLFTEIKTTSFVSVLENGCYIETGSVAIPKREPDVHDPMILQSLPNADDGERLATHEAMLDEASLARCTSPREVLPEELPALCRYGMKLLYDRLVREGQVTASPYGDEDEQMFRRTADQAELALAH